MDKRMETATRNLIEAIHASDAYQNYLSSKAELEAYPGALEEICRMRQMTMEDYDRGGQDDLIEISDRINDTYSNLMKIPAVHVFLESETELVKSLQTISDAVLNSVELYVPENEE